jgi:hypothetical protein
LKTKGQPLHCFCPVKQKRALLRSNPPRDNWIEGDEINVSTVGRVKPPQNRSGEQLFQSRACLENLGRGGARTSRSKLTTESRKNYVSNCPFFRSKPIPNPQYQWRFQGSSISDATNANLTITNMQLANGGNYDVVANNSFNTTTSAVAIVTVYTNAIAILSSTNGYLSGTNFIFNVRGVPGYQYRVDVTEDFVTWTPVLTNASSFDYTTNYFSTNSQHRFFRSVY